jgi:hypothetical protein
LVDFKKTEKEHTVMSMSETNENVQFAQERYERTLVAMQSAAGDGATLEMRMATLMNQLAPLRGLESSQLFAGVRAGITEARSQSEEGFNPLERAMRDTVNPHLMHAVADAQAMRHILAPDRIISPGVQSLERQCNSAQTNLEAVESLLGALIDMAEAVQTQIISLAGNITAGTALADNAVDQIQTYQEETGLI